MIKVMILKKLTSWLFKNKKNEASTLLGELSEAVDKTFTNDEERKIAQSKIEQLYAYNESTFVAGGRSALLWAVALVFVYQAAIREILIMVLNIKNPPEVGLSLTDMLESMIKLLAGIL